MKKLFLLVAIGVSAGFVVWMGLTTIGDYREGRMLTKVNDLRYLQLAIQTYAADAKKEKGKTIYPDSLEVLVRDNYLAQADFAKLHRWVTVEYFPPQAESPEGTVIMKTQYDGKTLLVPLDGEIIKK